MFDAWINGEMTMASCVVMSVPRPPCHTLEYPLPAAGWQRTRTVTRRGIVVFISKSSDNVFSCSCSFFGPTCLAACLLSARFLFFAGNRDRFLAVEGKRAAMGSARSSCSAASSGYGGGGGGGRGGVEGGWLQRHGCDRPKCYVLIFLFLSFFCFFCA